jgi:hypothetical protein
MSEIIKRKEFSIAITATAFLITFIPYFFNVPPIQSISTITIDWSLTIAYFVSVLAVISVTRRNITRMLSKSRSWIYGVITVVLMYYMIAVGFIFGTKDISFTFFYNSSLVPLESMVSGILLFYMASAGYRAFRVKNLKSGLLLSAVFLILLKNAPIGSAIWTGFQPVGTYVMDGIVGSANRAFKIGVAVAGIALTARVLLGRETSPQGLRGEG